MKRIAIGLCLALSMLGGVANAGSLTCSTNYGGYCQYDGTVGRVYVNAYNQIILYFDQDFGLSIPSQAGFSAVSGGMAVVGISDNPDFAKMFYATLLTAKTSGAEISVQFNSLTGGYLKADRIWLK